MEDARLMEEDGFFGKNCFLMTGETGTFWIVMKWDLRLWEVDCAWWLKEHFVATGSTRDALFLFDISYFVFTPSLPLIL